MAHGNTNSSVIGVPVSRTFPKLSCVTVASAAPKCPRNQVAQSQVRISEFAEVVPIVGITWIRHSTLAKARQHTG
eukprot:4346325-Amphidinium_carterae.1